MSLQDICKKFVSFFNFTFDAFMYISLSLEINSKHVMNDIVGIVCRSILLSSLRKLLLISFKLVFSKGDFQVVLVQEFVFLP
jgi:hypothetical protein